MRKRIELTDPTSCMSRANDEEMTFVLLGRDLASPATIRFWCAERVRLGKNKIDDPQIREALACAATMETEVAPNHCPPPFSLPDLIGEIERHAVERALNSERQVISLAARQLNISRWAFKRKMRQYGIEQRTGTCCRLLDPARELVIIRVHNSKGVGDETDIPRSARDHGLR